MNTRSDGLRLIHMARCEGGAIAPIVGVMLPVMFGMLGLVEAGKVYGVKNQLQVTADAAAMASVRQIPSGQASVEAEAADFANRNMPSDGQYGDVLESVEMGLWDGTTFVPAATPSNAVRVTTLAEMPLFFAAALGSLGVGAPASFTPSAQATALLRPDKCYDNGFLAGGIVQMNSSNNFKAGYCVYGRSGVTMNNSNGFEVGTEVGMANLANLSEGGNNPGLQEALRQKDISAPAAGEANLLIDQLEVGTGPIPDYITSIQTVSTMPSTLVPGTMYIYTGTSTVELSGSVADIAVVSDYTITIRSNSILRNVVLGSRQSVNIRANVTIGDVDYCTTGAGASLLISGGAVSDKDVAVGTNSNIHLHGVQVVSGGRIEMNSNLTITAASMQATTDIKFNSQFDVVGCPDGTSPNVTGGGTMVVQLVD
ncbi:MAG TPA: TadG family pilus assembly protein [Aestuariivirgaceae bacterium]|nr:TadG family pilus assembly protein [Aestuariivirgaceae bacterium]